MPKKNGRNLDYKEDLLTELRESPEFAAEYLSAAFADSRGAFLVALRDVIEARNSMAKVAAQAGVNRETLYRTLSASGNPTLATLDSIRSVLGLNLEFKPKRVTGGFHRGKRKSPTSLVRSRKAIRQSF